MKIKINFHHTILTTCLLICTTFSATAQQSDSMASSPKVFSGQFLKQQIVPLSLMGAGLLSLGHNDLFFNKYQVEKARNRDFPNFHTSADNYLALAAIGVNYGLDLLKVPARDDFINQTLLLAKSGIVTYGVVQIIKVATHEQRPDHSDYESFPSGHTAVAFMAATFLDKEFRSTSHWISVAGYTMATTTGVLRVLNNKHWIGDVLVGAGLGMLSTDIIFATHQYRWGRKPAAVAVNVFPFSLDGYPGFSVCVHF